ALLCEAALDDPVRDRPSHRRSLLALAPEQAQAHQLVTARVVAARLVPAEVVATRLVAATRQYLVGAQDFVRPQDLVCSQDFVGAEDLVAAAVIDSHGSPLLSAADRGPWRLMFSCALV